MVKTHEWREETEEGRRVYRAQFYGGAWRLRSQFKGEEFWQVHDPVKQEEWEKLRDVVYRKYQRGNCPWKLIEVIDKNLQKIKGE